MEKKINPKKAENSVLCGLSSPEYLDAGSAQEKPRFILTLVTADPGGTASSCINQEQITAGSIVTHYRQMQGEACRAIYIKSDSAKPPDTAPGSATKKSVGCTSASIVLCPPNPGWAKKLFVFFVQHKLVAHIPEDTKTGSASRPAGWYLQLPPVNRDNRFYSNLTFTRIIHNGIKGSILRNRWFKTRIHISDRNSVNPLIPVCHCSKCGTILGCTAMPDICPECSSTHLHRDSFRLSDNFLKIAAYIECFRKIQQTFDLDLISLLIVRTDAYLPALISSVTLEYLTGSRLFVSDILCLGSAYIRGRRTIPAVPPDSPRSFQHAVERYGPETVRISLLHRFPSSGHRELDFTQLKCSRNFMNKIWSAARFVHENLNGDEDGDINAAGFSTADRWMLHGLNFLALELTEDIENYRFRKYFNKIYRFFRYEYCNWYIEFCKCDLQSLHSRKALKHSFADLLRLLYPLVPAITQAIYQKIFKNSTPVFQSFPVFNSNRVYSPEFRVVEEMKILTAKIRRMKIENNIPVQKHISLFLSNRSKKRIAEMNRETRYLEKLAGIGNVWMFRNSDKLPAGYAENCNGWNIVIPLDTPQEKSQVEELLFAEKKQLEKQIREFEAGLNSIPSGKAKSEIHIFELKRSMQKSRDQIMKIEKTLRGLRLK